MGMIADKMNLKPGDIGFTRITGVTGWWVNLGQALTGDSCRYTHVFVVMDDDTVLEAMPSGARYAPLDREYKTDVLYARLPLTDEQRSRIVGEARRLMSQPKGIPYGFSDYLALALSHWGLNAKRLRKYIANNGRMICSQLADYLLSHAGFQVFNDGRLPQDVTPGDLYYGTDTRILGAQKAGEPDILPDAKDPL